VHSRLLTTTDLSAPTTGGSAQELGIFPLPTNRVHAIIRVRGSWGDLRHLSYESVPRASSPYPCSRTVLTKIFFVFLLSLIYPTRVENAAVIPPGLFPPYVVRARCTMAPSGFALDSHLGSCLLPVTRYTYTSRNTHECTSQEFLAGNRRQQYTTRRMDGHTASTRNYPCPSPTRGNMRKPDNGDRYVRIYKHRLLEDKDM
jgi:hypothetical protein